MKNILFSIVIALGLSSVSAFANEPAAPAPAAGTETTTAAPTAKMDKKAAKEACKEKKGKEHKACMKEHMGK